jgi:hypothetical protein
MKHDNFLKAQEWLNSCDYPDMDSALEWLDEISLRVYLKVFMGLHKDEFKSFTPQEFFQLVKADDKQILLSKDFDMNKEDSLPINTLTLKDLSILSFCAATNSSTRSSFLDVLKYGFFFSQDHAIAAAENMRFNDIEKLFSSASDGEESVNDWDNLENITVNSITDNRLNVNKQHRVYLSVDLNCRRVELLDQFRKWLSIEQKAYRLNVKKDYKSMFNKWNSHRFLALLDLESWCILKEIKLTTGQKIELLYPDIPMDDDNYRNTYRHGAKLLLDDTVMSQLRSIAYVDKESIEKV